MYTGELRYLEFQGNGKNTSSFPKFEIANYDITRIHVHEEKKKSTFVKSALLQNVCNTNLKDVCIENKIEIKAKKWKFPLQIHSKCKFCKEKSLMEDSDNTVFLRLACSTVGTAI